jgi:nucleotide-binding universal stress UspA family protein
MFNKILIPTDGSDIANEAALAGIEFAKHNHSEVIGIYVAPEYQYPIYVEIIPPTYPTEEEYGKSMRKIGDAYLQPVQEAAEKAGLKYSGVVVFSNATGPRIAAIAQEKGCDLIFMGSHGRTGLSQLLLGSVTTKVLATCAIPVMVYRRKKVIDSNPADRTEMTG